MLTTTADWTSFNNTKMKTDVALRSRSLHYFGMDEPGSTKETTGNDATARGATIDEGQGSRINLKSKIFNVLGYTLPDRLK